MPGATKIVVLAAIVLMLSMGVRASYGVFMTPILASRDWTREIFSTAFAVQNLAWGVGAICMGMLADRFGTARVLAASGALYALGLAGTLAATTQAELIWWTGIVVGLGQGGTSSALVLPIVARIVTPQTRSLAMGIANAGGSFGQFLLVPVSALLIHRLDWQAAMLLLSVALATILPLAWMLRERPQGHAAPDAGATAAGTSFREALAHRSMWLLGGSYFVCGFQLAFVTLHLPSYVKDRGLDTRHGAAAIALIGLFNVLGSVLSGYLGGRYSKKRLLGWNYALRGVLIALLLVFPLTPALLYIFAAGMGLLWLSTVPLTMGLVGDIFGLRRVATLGGAVFLCHQLGSASGVYLAGLSFAYTGSYDMVWTASIVIAAGAALLAWSVAENQPPRTALAA